MAEIHIFDGIKDYYKLGERKQFRVWLSIKWKDVSDVTDVTLNPTSHYTRELEWDSVSQPKHMSPEVISEEKV